MKYIYMSCLLTILNSLVLTSDDEQKLQDTYSLPESKYRLLDRLYKNNKENALILYHLPQTYSDYIKVLVRQVMKAIEIDIRELSAYDIPISDDILADLVFLELDGKVNFD